jgi:uncharacterized protein (TIGR02452 family)
VVDILFLDAFQAVCPVVGAWTTIGTVKSQRKAIAEDTVRIIESGQYRVGERVVPVGAQIARAVAGTRLYEPGDAVAGSSASSIIPKLSVTNESSLEAARRLGGDVACLNFASARNPGGGFQNGAQAQEESLARSSALYACLLPMTGFYDYHRHHAELTYSDRVIYSPGVPVFRDDEGGLLPEPYLVSFLTAAAPNRGALARTQPGLLAEVQPTLVRRAGRVLAIAASHGHRRLVLGAWGCGVFGNDPNAVAQAFAVALQENPWFEEVTFAVLDQQKGTPTYAAFSEVLARDS